jgi:diguanylate cyclase (GGDEF)-like protein
MKIDLDKYGILPLDIINYIKYLEEKVETDELTGIFNRRFFAGVINHELKHYKRGQRKKFAIVFADLNKFKNINDGFGHNFGDEYLKITAQKLKKSVRESDIVARYAGDEFVLLLEDIESEEELESALNKIKTEFAKLEYIYDQSLIIGISLGGIIVNEDMRAEDLIDIADQKMYSEKKLQKA